MPTRDSAHDRSRASGHTQESPGIKSRATDTSREDADRTEDESPGEAKGRARGEVPGGGEGDRDLLAEGRVYCFMMNESVNQSVSQSVTGWIILRS